MLTLTENASSAIREIVDQSELPDGAGLRLSLDSENGAEAQLHVALALEPAENDERVEEGGAHVFLDRGASRILEDQTLDASVTSEGEVGFSFLAQKSASGRGDEP
jgi:Fe-S cluster assembly iron-binding protein IscA